MQNEIEQRINEMPDLGYDEPDQRDYYKKIAQITFAFHNADIINRLATRGTYIKTEKWDKVKQINTQIAESLDDEEYLDKLQRPCSIFATFETEEGYNRACVYNDLIQMKFLGQDIEIQEASEPTDIIWENRFFTQETRRYKRIFVYFTIVVMLSISAVIIYRFTMISQKAKFKYPKVDCGEMEH